MERSALLVLLDEMQEKSVPGAESVAFVCKVYRILCQN